MSQYQSLGKRLGPQTDVGAPLILSKYRHVPSFSRWSTSTFYELLVWPYRDSATQIIWLLCRWFEQVAIPQCSFQCMEVYKHGPWELVQGPLLWYQMAPSEGWALGQAEPPSNNMTMLCSLLLGTEQAKGQIYLPRFSRIINSEMEGADVPNFAFIPDLSGVSWPDNVKNSRLLTLLSWPRSLQWYWLRQYIRTPSPKDYPQRCLNWSWQRNVKAYSLG